MKRVVFIFLSIIMIMLAFSRIDMDSNISSNGLIHEKVEASNAIRISIIPITLGNGYQGSMNHLVSIVLVFMILVYMNYKHYNSEVYQKIFILFFFSISLLVFEETIIRILGCIVFIMTIFKLLEYRKTKII